MNTIKVNNMIYEEYLYEGELLKLCCDTLEVKKVNVKIPFGKYLYVIDDNDPWPHVIKIVDNVVYIYKKHDYYNTDNKPIFLTVTDNNPRNEFTENFYPYMVIENPEYIHLNNDLTLSEIKSRDKDRLRTMDISGYGIIIKLKKRNFLCISGILYLFQTHDDEKHYLVSWGNNTVCQSSIITQDNKVYLIENQFIKDFVPYTDPWYYNDKKIPGTFSIRKDIL